MGDATCRECEKCGDIKEDVKEMLPIVREAERLMKGYPEHINSVDEIKVSQKIEDITTKRILERMDTHDINEREKRKERKEENRARKSNFITIIIAVLGLGVAFAIWLNNFTHNSDLRLQKIETALGIEHNKRNR